MSSMHRRARLVVVTMIATLTLVGLAGCPGTSGPGDGSGSTAIPGSLRLTTFNTHLPSPAMCFLAQEGLLKDPTDDCHSEAHAADIGNALAASGADVIALNEVWDENAKEILALQLVAAGYTHVIRKLDDDLLTVHVDELPEFKGEDSGLMLFSRYPFANLPLASFRQAVNGGDIYASPWDNLETSPGDEGKVAFIRYKSCDDDDCMAAKGAGLVRIEKDGRVYSVVFTHMQADYGDDSYPSVRDAQRDAVKYLIDHTLGSPLDPEADLFIVGDLNTIGGGPEWGMLNADFPGQDAWMASSSGDDNGSTNNGQRLDYHLYNLLPPTANTPQWASLAAENEQPHRLCPQHIRIVHQGLSDHFGVSGEYAEEAPMCAPSLASKNPPYDKWIKKTLEGFTTQLLYPGSSQWFRIDDAGTFAFEVQSKAPGETDWSKGVVAYEVYQSTDMSHPFTPYKQMTSTFTTCQDPSEDCKPETLTVPSFALPSAPFYVKVFHPDRSWSGDYDLIIHKSRCESMQDACVLRPKVPETDPGWSDSQPLNADDTAWFRLDTHAANSKKEQDLAFDMTNPTGGAATFALRDENGAVLTDRTSNGNVTFDKEDISTVDPDLLVGPDTLYLTITRPAPVAGVFKTGLTAGWRTNLTILHGLVAGARGQDDYGRPLSPMMFVDVEETGSGLGELGSDEVTISFIADGIKYTPVSEREVDEGEYFFIDELQQPIAYVTYLDVEFREIGGGEYSSVSRLSTLASQEQRSWSLPVELGIDDGTWRLTVNLSAQLDT